MGVMQFSWQIAGVVIFVSCCGAAKLQRNGQRRKPDLNPEAGS